MYFDDLHVGFVFETESRSLSEDEIIAFASEYDAQPFHIDRDAAAQSIYGGIIASGFQTMLVAFRLTLESGVWNEASMGSPGMRDVQWRHPVRPGDALRVRAEVVGSTPSSSRPDRGRTEIRYDVLNQSGDVVMCYTATHILKRKPAE
ncbi:MaoC family dehydratase [Lutimaribacter saemankumensis]|mgnify:CR=1 FL=1|uniref:Acyl dehydratase n=1 Tax=Lutimaribacter saemankumensis TaxID=490829 RepID=A0A1G8JAH0_9RHOB|nr:MaoC family dehydratase [Lutimaribacter saemankumensis]SDI28073.1 Acyl dehydratase [Lutimaribacter saemankumensis]